MRAEMKNADLEHVGIGVSDWDMREEDERYRTAVDRATLFVPTATGFKLKVKPLTDHTVDLELRLDGRIADRRPLLPRRLDGDLDAGPHTADAGAVRAAGAAGVRLARARRDDPHDQGAAAAARPLGDPVRSWIQIAKGLAALAAGHSPRAIVRGGFAALRALGPRGLMRRAAAAVTQQEDDERYRRWLAAAPPSPIVMTAGAAAPLVSIITPVFNTHPAWLERCIASVRAQTYAQWELILSDDGSTAAGTLEVLRAAVSAADPRVQVIRAAANGGIVAASNAALERARGEFVGFLDHDDELAPEALAAVVARLELTKPGEPPTDVVYTDEDKIDPAGARRQAHFKPDWSPELLDSCMYVSHFTVMRRRIAVDAGGFRAGFDGSQDYDLMLRVAERTDRIAHVPRVLYGWRMAPDSAASSQLAKPWAVRAGQRALEEAIARRGLSAVVTSAGAAGHFRVRYAIAGAPVTSILMPSPATARARRRRCSGPPGAGSWRSSPRICQRPAGRWRRASTPWRGARPAVTCCSSMTMWSRADRGGSTP